MTAERATWAKTRLGWLFEPISDRGHADAMVLSVYRDHGVVPKESRTDNFNRTPENLSNYQLVEPGDLVVNRMKAWQGSLGISEYRGIVSPDYEVLRPTYADYDRRFLHSLLRSRAVIDQYVLRSTGIRPSQWRLYWEDMKTIEISVPSGAQQRAIADYLDRETARIDTLIEEQQRLIEMLRERRQAVVDAAFAGLDEARVQLRRYIKFLTSGSRGWGDYYADEGERFLRIGNLSRTNLSIRGEIQFVDLPTDVTEGSRTVLQAGDLLFSITAYLGSVAVVDGDWVGSYVSQHVALCRLDPERVSSRFIGWFMLTTSGQDQLNEGAAGGAKLQLALDDVKGLRVPTAPIADQRRIAERLDEQTATIDTLIDESERFIELARERRAALITAAVTGQIDVWDMA
jgi:type I restriction enzyme S subunit